MSDLLVPEADEKQDVQEPVAIPVEEPAPRPVLSDEELYRKSFPLPPPLQRKNTFIPADLPEPPQGLKWEPMEAIEAPDTLKAASPNYADTVMSELQRDKVNNPAMAFDKAMDIDPSKSAYWLEKLMDVDSEAARYADMLARGTRLPADIVETDPVYVEKVKRAQDVLKKLTEKDETGNWRYPNTIKFYSNPTKARLAVDDSETLMAIENQARFESEKNMPFLMKAGMAARAGIQSVSSVIAGAPAGLARFAEDWFLWSDVGDALEEENYQRQKKNMPTITMAEFRSPEYQTVANTRVANQLPTQEQWLNNLQKAQGILTKEAAKQAPMANPEGMFNQIGEGDIGGAAQDVSLMAIQQVPQTAAMLGLAFSGLGSATLPAFFGSSYETGAQEALREGQGYGSASVRGLGYGVFEAVMEMFSLRLIDDLAKAPAKMAAMNTSEFIAKLGTMATANFIKEGGSEALTSLGQSGTKALTGGDVTIKGTIEDATVSGLVGGLTGGGQTLVVVTPATVLRRWSQQQIQAKAIGGNVQTLEQIKEIASNSKLAKTNPEAFAEARDEIIEANGIDSKIELYTDEVNTLFQGDAEQELAFWESMGVTVDQLAKAQENSTPVSVSASLFAAKHGQAPVFEHVKRLFQQEAADIESVANRKLMQYMDENGKTKTTNQNKKDELPELKELREHMTKPITEGGLGMQTREAEFNFMVYKNVLNGLAKAANMTLPEYVKSRQVEVQGKNEVTELADQVNQEIQLNQQNIAELTTKVQDKDVAIEVRTETGQNVVVNGKANVLLQKEGKNREVLSVLRKCLEGAR